MREAITTDYADGFRAGWRAAIEAAARECRQEEMDDWPLDTVSAYGAAVARACVNAIRALEPPAPMREPTGLEERGG